MNPKQKFISATVLFFFITTMLPAQEWMKNLPQNKETNFYDVQKAFNEYWNNKNFSPYETKNKADGEYQQFKRWEKFMEPRVYPSGKFNSLALWDEYHKFASEEKKTTHEKSINNWTPLGPLAIPGNGGGMGRINVVEVDPFNSNTLWIGSPNGGLWKTTNGGTSWTSNTDLLPNISIADIAIDHQNTNNMYIATGDGYAYEAGGIVGSFQPFWGGTYSAGVLKSTDGGATWNATGLTYSQMQNNVVQRILVSPVNSQLLLAAARDGLWRSTDAGATWTNVLMGHVFDIEFNTINAAKVYASKSDDIYVSSNSGLTWTPANVGYSNSPERVSIAVTPADPTVIYVLTSNGELYRSANGGSSFPYVGMADAGYGYYNTIINVSQLDANTVYTSGVDVSKSIDGGQSFTTTSDYTAWPASNYDHADGHDVKVNPHGNDTVYNCNDGGVFRTTDGGISWTDISSNISIAQFYRLSCSQTNPNIVYCGQQDNGSVKYNGTYWEMKMWADGMEQLVDFADSNKVFSCSQYGSINMSTDGGATYFDVSPDMNGDWITPIIIDPNNNQNYYTAYNYVYKSTDGGYSFNPISTDLLGSPLNVLAIAPSNSNYLYTGDYFNLFRTTNGGTSWTSITAGLPVSNAAITYIGVSNTNPQKIWVTLSGYTAGNKVFKSVNGGTTWTNDSGTLSNVPVDCIVYVNNSNDGLYIGTDFGVFYKDNTLTDWVPFDNGLPNVIVDELEIQYNTMKLRAATYGRGLWESDISLLGVQVADLSAENNITVYPNPSAGRFEINSTKNRIESITVFNVIGEEVYQSVISNLHSTLDLTSFTKGIYFVRIVDENKTVVNKKIIKD